MRDPAGRVNAQCIVAALHLRWDGVRQRPHHVLARLAERMPVLVVEEPFAAPIDADDVAVYGALTRLRPKRRAGAPEPFDTRTLAAVRAWIADRAPLLWFYQPMMLALADAFPEAPVAYDCMDELAAFDFAPPELPARERSLERRANAIFTGGRSLYERRRELGDRVRLYASGVDVTHFARAVALGRPQILASLASPVCTYVGAIDERIDFAPIVALAERGASVVLVGPVVKLDPALLPRHRNIHFTGPVPYDELPTFLAGTDVAIMPFMHNAATRSISPTKTPEYLAAERPVVSTAIADVIADYGEVVYIAHDAQSFAAACVAVAANPNPQRVARGRGLAGAGSWDSIVFRMWLDVEREANAR